MAWADESSAALLPVDRTRIRVVLSTRLLGWIWMMGLVAVALATEPETTRPVLVSAMLLATVGTRYRSSTKARRSASGIFHSIVDPVVAVAGRRQSSPNPNAGPRSH